MPLSHSKNGLTSLFKEVRVEDRGLALGRVCWVMVWAASMFGLDVLLTATYLSIIVNPR